MRPVCLICVLAILCVMPSGHTDAGKPTAPAPKGSRILSIDVNSPQNGDYNSAFTLAKGLGMQDIGLSLDWSDIETASGQYDGKWLSIANSYYPKTGTAVSLTIRPLHNSRKTVPEDLSAVPFDDPRMIERFRKLIDFVFAQIPDLRLDGLIIGSEFDVYLGTDDNLWTEYTRFYKAASAYARTKRPGLKIAAESTYAGLTGSAKGHMQVLNASSDLIGVSYYPIKSDFSVEEPSVLRERFGSLVRLYPGKPICFYQFGYPSSPELGSSQEKQAEFIREAFRAWDRYASHIRMVDFTWLHDIPEASVEQNVKYFRLSAPRFRAFLATLGMRTFAGAGADKTAFRVLKQETRARGWQ